MKTETITTQPVVPQLLATFQFSQDQSGRKGSLTRVASFGSGDIAALSGGSGEWTPPKGVTTLSTSKNQACSEASTPARQVDYTSLVDRERVLKSFLEIVQIVGGSRDERRVADYVKGELQKLELQATEDDAGEKIGGNTGNLIVNIPGNFCGAPPLIFAAHMDTVRLARGVRPVVVNGYVKTDGTTALGGDDRAGVTEILEAIKIIKENNLPHGDIQLIFTVAEEAGLLGSSELDPKVLHGKMGFVVDSFKPNQIFFSGDGEPLYTDRGDLEGAHEERALKEFSRPESAKDYEALGPHENEIVKFTKKAINDIGQTPEFRTIYGAGSDASSLRERGVPALTIGAGEENIHTRREQVAIQDLVDSTRLLLALIQNSLK